jgi:hypothetical protein
LPSRFLAPPPLLPRVKPFLPYTRFFLACAVRALFPRIRPSSVHLFSRRRESGTRVSLSAAASHKEVITTRSCRSPVGSQVCSPLCIHAQFIPYR